MDHLGFWEVRRTSMKERVSDKPMKTITESDIALCAAVMRHVAPMISREGDLLDAQKAKEKANLELAEAHEELLELRRELTKAQNLPGKLQKDVEFWKKDCDERGKEIHRLEGELKETNGEVEDLKLRTKELMAKLETCEAANAELTKISNERYEKIEELKTYKKDLEKDIKILTEENAGAAKASLLEVEFEEADRVAEDRLQEKRELQRKLALSQASNKQKDERIQELLELRGKLVGCVDRFTEYMTQLREWE